MVFNCNTRPDGCLNYVNYSVEIPSTVDCFIFYSYHFSDYLNICVLSTNTSQHCVIKGYFYFALSLFLNTIFLVGLLQDLPRTFPGHPALNENGRNSLRRVLSAYAVHNPSVGYCQVVSADTAILFSSPHYIFSLWGQMTKINK